MIVTSKLLPRRLNNSSPSPQSGKNLVTIRNGLKEIDGLLKERLVFAKVREGILKQQEERRRRFEREKIIERKDKDSDYDIGNPLQRSTRPKPGTGGIIGGIASTLTRIMGVAAFARIGSLLKAGRLIKLLLNPKVVVIASTITILSNVISRVNDDIFKKVKPQDAEKLRGDSVNNTINGFIESMQYLAAAMLGAASIAAIQRRLANRRNADAFARERSMLYSFGEKGKAKADAEADMRADKAKRRDIRKRASQQIKVDEEIAETASRQSRVVRSTQREVGSQIIARKAGGAPTSVIDKGRGMTGIMKRNSFLIDPSEGFDVRSKLTKDGVETFFLGDSNIRLTEIDVGGQTLFEARKTPALRNRIAKKFGIKPKDFDFDEVFDTFEIRSNLGRKAGQDAGIEALLDQINMRDTKGFSTRQQADMAKFLDQTIFGDKITRANVRAQQKAANDFASRAGTRFRGSGVVSRGRVGSRQFLRPDGTSTDAAYKAALKSMKEGGKKATSEAVTGVGLRGGLKGIRKFIGESIGVIPIIGDIVGILLDIFVFGEPIGRAAFMGIGSALLGLIGGLLGSIGGPPGIFALGLLGSIGGDFLGAAFYDFLFKTDSGDVNVATKTVKGLVKTAGLFTGGFATDGMYRLGELGTEFVFDADTTAAIEKKIPGLLMSLNRADANGTINILRDYAFYESEAGSEKIIPLPFPMMTELSNKRQKIVLLDNGSGGDNRTFSQLYRRG